MIKNKFQDLKIILASQSPRRKELLSSLELIFESFTKSIDESYPQKMEPTSVAKFLSEKKSNEYTIKDNEIIITADTIVIHKNNILNKPKDKMQAARMLRLISGSSNNVMTGVCVRSNNKQISFAESTQVTFDSLEESEIQFYIEKYNPLDKAGAYGIQDWIGKIGVKNINGCYYNVMGLPIHRLYQELKRF
ncbi:MAG: Maf family nucleotide pyrophosphatase [Flavobacteriales bacterium]|tara:strand:- start:2138 stop:2713 length:576 start_codon:yes stop_codon:yes gene_type:complete